MRTCMVFLTLFLFLNNVSNAQAAWTEGPTGQRFFSGIPLSCADVNGDGVDDLIILDQAKHLWLGLHDGISRFFWISLPYHQTFAAWSVNVADIDNNGWNDILISGESTGLVVLYQTAGNFIPRVADARYFFSQAAAAYDINQDGWLDFTLCDDNNATRIYLNNGAGELEYDTALINLTLPEAGKSGGNYGCIWSDYDRDGDGDLYLSKCRAGVDDPKDARRINLHYVKDSAGWTERGAYNGVDVSDQSWVSLMEDFDRDGLFDLLVVNHYTPCRIFHQKPDHRFEERTAESGLEFSAIAIQAVPGDFDNDGDIDVLLTGNTVELWLNDGQMRFTKADLHPGDRRFSSCAAGDFNGDGWLDVYASYADLLNTPNNQHDRLWLNPGGSHHHAGF
ncbi:MAG TPA: VCBS repeat-containing protein, partial [Saprospiraceae bacterium]|nr:VCBS repeat-containing protein [Saprospiraceae bacterium]